MIIKRPMSEFELRYELRQFERHYRLPSERLHEAFREKGRLQETPAYIRWSALWTAYKAVTGKSVPA